VTSCIGANAVGKPTSGKRDRTGASNAPETDATVIPD